MEGDCGVAPAKMMLAIGQYELTVKTLTDQVEFYSTEQENLRQEISGLVKENDSLRSELRQMIDPQALSKGCKCPERESLLVHNLTGQLNLIMKEKDALTELWQTALKNIDRLEEELKLFSGRTHGYFSKAQVQAMKHKYETRTEELEQQLSHSQVRLDGLTRLVDNKTGQLEESLETHRSSLSRVRVLENEAKVLQANLDEIIKYRDELQKRLDQKDVAVETLRASEAEARSRVVEALQLVQCACMEKDAALFSESHAKSELAEVSKELTQYVDRFKSEKVKMRSELDAKLGDARREIDRLERELKIRVGEVEFCERSRKALEIELTRKRDDAVERYCTDEVKMLNKSFESTLEKLLVSEKKASQFEVENASLRMELSRIEESHRKSVRETDEQKGSMSRKVRDLKEQLANKSKQVKQVLSEVEKLKLVNASMETELQDKLKLKESQLQKTLISLHKKNELSESKLQTYLKDQLIMHNKWKTEMHETVEQMSQKITNLLASNKLLKQELLKSVSSNLKHKITLEEMCSISNVDDENCKMQCNKYFCN